MENKIIFLQFLSCEKDTFFIELILIMLWCVGYVNEQGSDRMKNTGSKWQRGGKLQRESVVEK